MKFAVERDILLHALSHAHRIVAKTDAVPILTTALVKAEGETLALVATNGEMVAETACRAEVEGEGQAAVRLNLLMDILRKLPAGTALRFDRDADTGQLVMLYRRSRVQLPTLPADEFAAFGIETEAAEARLPAPALAKLLSVPAWVPKADHHVLYAGGIHLHFAEADAAIVAVAADGVKLSSYRVTGCADALSLPPVTVPLRSCAEIVKLAQALGPDPVALRVTPSLLSAAGAGTVLTTKLIECQFPDYRRAIPPDTIPKAVMSAGDLAAALDRVRLLADDDYQTVRFEILDGILNISAKSKTGGTILETVEVEGGDGIRFGAKSAFAISALNALDADAIDLATEGLGAPVVMRPRGGGAALSLIMPLRV